MSIDVSGCLGVVEEIKSYVEESFIQCVSKGSGFTDAYKLKNLPRAIALIPTSEGAIGGTSVDDASFSGFTVTWNEDGEDTYTVDFGTWGSGWKAISCYSTTKDGHYNIVKISNTHCIISGAYFVDLQSEWDENHGIYPYQRGTFRASYSISGSKITFTNDEYDGATNGFSVPDGFVGIVTQASNTINDYYTNPYKLDRITVLY